MGESIGHRIFVHGATQPEHQERSTSAAPSAMSLISDVYNLPCLGRRLQKQVGIPRPSIFTSTPRLSVQPGKNVSCRSDRHKKWLTVDMAGLGRNRQRSGVCSKGAGKSRMVEACIIKLCARYVDGKSRGSEDTARSWASKVTWALCGVNWACTSARRASKVDEELYGIE